MRNSIIEVKNLGKKYNIAHQQGGYVALRDVLTNVFKNPFQFAKHKAKQIVGLETKEEFWALKDVNFTVEKGEAVGIIGANGAGKSTLLKILTGITPPTTGEVIMRGKVASLLEVGTGFHPELTGRENIFLNGAILGMTKKEISDRFNDIVKFSGVEKFLDTPVKYYSSGMSVRLAFAVAAHLEPDILIIDEVLAVGDAEFQKKCLGKMNEITNKDGRTILFVSHNMEAIQNLCKKCILLQRGKIIMIGETKKIISTYTSKQFIDSEGFIDLSDFKLRKNSSENSLFRFTHCSIINSNGKISSQINFKEKFSLIIEGYLENSVDNLLVGFSINSSLGYPLFNSFNKDYNLPKSYKKGKIIFKIIFNNNFLVPGQYIIGLGCNGKEITDWIPEALNITIQQSINQNDLNVNYGIIYPCEWLYKS
ncbi:MAG: ABC transporter ATP-binding protein [bacterium]|nr:ABC transporter ATP-binding protein [bacterium]